MHVSDVVRVMETLAPPELAESWDNVGLLVGDASAPVRRVLLCVDVTDEVLAEAVETRAGMIVAHHPPIFRPVGRITAAEAPVAYRAARRGIALYAAHTNLDAAPGGTNDALADALGLTDRRPLQPACRDGQAKIVVFVQPDNMPRVAGAAFAAGAGRIGNYSDCAFFSHGIGSFFGRPGSSPAVGAAGRHEAAEELRLEVICPRGKVAAVLAAVRAAHSYETPAIDVYPLLDLPAGAGNGRVGRLPRPVTVRTLAERLKRAAGAARALLAAPQHGRAARADGRGRLVATAACCAGAGASAWRDALAAGAALYATGEMDHHAAGAAAAAGLTVLCLGHGNSERLVLPSLARRLAAALPALRVAASKRDRDPYQTI